MRNVSRYLAALFCVLCVCAGSARAAVVYSTIRFSDYENYVVTGGTWTINYIKITSALTGTVTTLSAGNGSTLTVQTGSAAPTISVAQGTYALLDTGVGLKFGLDPFVAGVNQFYTVAISVANTNGSAGYSGAVVFAGSGNILAVDVAAPANDGPQAAKLLFDGSSYVKSDPQTNVTIAGYAAGQDPVTLMNAGVLPVSPIAGTWAEALIYTMGMAGRKLTFPTGAPGTAGATMVMYKADNTTILHTFDVSSPLGNRIP